MSIMIENFINNKLCVGCGICAGICPQKALIMQFDINGEYIPFKENICLPTCGLCMNICPFNDKNMNESEIGKVLFGELDGIKYSEEVGYYLDLFVGYSEQFREKSASGGIGTNILKNLLENKIVNYVVCVTPQTDNSKLFKYEIFEDVNSVISSSGSVYYPVELSDIVRVIIEKPGNYAIVGLPCFIKGLRLATFHNSKLKKRIVYMIGLVCGQTKSKLYTAYLSELAGVGGELQKVYFRGKSIGEPASNFYFYCQNKNGDEGKLYWDEGVSEAFTNRWFTPNACNFCDDVFAELADISLMDAWLPEYIENQKGTSLVIIRSPEILNMFNKIMGMDIRANRISLDKIKVSQKGVLDFKRDHLPYRLHQLYKNNKISLKKRYESNSKLELLQKEQMTIKTKMQAKSSELFFSCYNNKKFDVDNFKREMYRCAKWNYKVKFLKICKRFMRLIRN